MVSLRFLPFAAVLSATLPLGCASGGSTEYPDFADLPIYSALEPPRCPYEEVEMLTYGGTGYSRDPIHAGTEGSMARQTELERRTNEISRVFVKSEADAIVQRQRHQLEEWVFIRFTEPGCYE